MTLTKEQLDELTERINDRISEFAPIQIPRVSAGVVRLTYEVIAEWERQTGNPFGLAVQEDGHVGAGEPAERLMIDDPPAEPEPPQKNDEKLTERKVERLSESAVSTLGPEHVKVTPLSSHAVVIDHNGLSVAAINQPRTLAEADELDDDAASKPKRRVALGEYGRRAKQEAEELRRRAQERERERKPTREMVIAELKRQAMAGVMPSQQAYDIAKPAVWAKAQATCLRLGVTWEQLAAEAGLRMARRKPEAA